MFPDEYFPRPRSSYERPAPLISVDPGENADYTVCFRREYLPYILGSLTQLEMQTTWDTTDPDEILLMQQRAADLKALFIDGCPVGMPETGCVAYPPSASFVSYYPQDPYTQPGFIPDWYSAVPFVVIDSELAGLLTGTQIGDVIALQGSFPNPTAIVEKGLSDIRLDVVGPGIVEVHFVAIIAGGTAEVTVDDDGLNTRTVDLNADVIQVPPETPGELVEEFTLTGAGPHHLNIRFAPVVDDSLTVLRYGGAVRSIVLCAVDAPNEAFDMLRSSGCVIEVSHDGGITWATLIDITPCATAAAEAQINADLASGKINAIAAGDPRTSGDPAGQWPAGSVPAGQTAQCLSGANISDALKASVDKLLADLTAGVALLQMAAAQEALLALILSPFVSIGAALTALAASAISLGASVVAAAFTSGTYDTFKCIVECHSDAAGKFNQAAFDAIKTDVTTQLSSVAASLINQWLDTRGRNGLTLSTKASGITSASCATCDCAVDWARRLDFTLGQYATTGIHANYVASQGWNYANDGFTAMYITLPADFVTADLRHIKLYWIASGTLFAGRAIQIYDKTGNSNYAGTGTTDITSTFSQGSSNGRRIGGNGIGSGGNLRLTKVEVWGHSVTPPSEGVPF